MQVDIFSYGIWLYELMSGYRPFRKFRSNAEMKKAIIRGVRPSLRQDSINSNLPFLECIMEVRITFLIQKFRPGKYFTFKSITFLFFYYLRIVGDKMRTIDLHQKLL